MRPLGKTRDNILDLWQSGENAVAIAKALKMGQAGVRVAIQRARRQGDVRAIHHQPGARDTWAPEDVESVKTLWADGWSAESIARKIGHGITRSAVIGKVHRLKLIQRRPRGIVSSGVAVKRPRPVGSGRIREVARARLKGAGGILAFKPAKLWAEPPAAPDCAPVTLLDRSQSQCGFILGEPKGPETLMCGAPKELPDGHSHGSVYCTYHLSLAYYARRVEAAA